MRPTVFIPEYMASCGIDMLKAECDCIIPWEHGAQLMDIPQGDHPLRAPLYEADAVIVRVINITAQDLERPNRLKVIVKHGVGIDNIDCQAAADHGIPVAYTPTGNTNAVAEHTLALILALMRRLEPAGEALRQGRFSERNDFLGDELSEKTLGIIGLGRIGSRVAKKAAGGAGNDGPGVRSVCFAGSVYGTGHPCRFTGNAASHIGYHHPACPVNNGNETHHQRTDPAAHEARMPDHQYLTRTGR